jgi:hypothetical protein
MKRRLIALAALAATVVAPVVTAEVTRENFLMRSGQDLAALCGAGTSDPYFERALSFCHGYLVGSYDFYKGTSAGRPSRQLVCLPKPPPARYEVALQFVEWARRNPRDASESAVDALYRFAALTWPCKRK